MYCLELCQENSLLIQELFKQLLMRISVIDFVKSSIGKTIQAFTCVLSSPCFHLSSLPTRMPFLCLPCLLRTHESFLFPRLPAPMPSSPLFPLHRTYSVPSQAPAPLPLLCPSGSLSINTDLSLRSRGFNDVNNHLYSLNNTPAKDPRQKRSIPLPENNRSKQNEEIPKLSPNL